MSNGAAVKPRRFLVGIKTVILKCERSEPR
jgi:hypothetical protein